MNTQNQNTTENIAALKNDFIAAVLTVSLFVNLATFVTWLAFSLS